MFTLDDRVGGVFDSQWALRQSLRVCQRVAAGER
jgi:hypothetical protein